MRMRKIDRRDAEKRPISIEPGRHEFGRSKGVVQCPFCGHRNIVYLWSFYGGGKRCMNPHCRAFLAIPEASRDMVPAEVEAECMKTTSEVCRADGVKKNETAVMTED